MSFSALPSPRSLCLPSFPFILLFLKKLIRAIKLCDRFLLVYKISRLLCVTCCKIYFFNKYIFPPIYHQSVKIYLDQRQSKFQDKNKHYRLFLIYKSKICTFNYPQIHFRLTFVIFKQSTYPYLNLLKYNIFFSLAQQPNADQGHIILGASRSHIMTQLQSVGLLWTSDKRQTSMPPPLSATGIKHNTFP